MARIVARVPSRCEADGISEGFGDYWAGPACIADWDAVSYTAGPIHCLRRLDRDLKYPTDITGAVHRDGQIWSHALWNLRTAIGPAHADTAILWAQIDWTGTDMPDLAQRVVDQVEDRYGAGEAALAVAAFAERRILED